ncbi:MAG: nucleotidyltransferase family protein [Firmicutes bacterium]|nr:nucleotidyltransferase family protein [Bacillota bacterium]
MTFAAVICEFNPLHNGHAYLLAKAKKRTGCDALVCVMSGNFVQRAEPAVADMRTRAHAALLCGADAVIELPALYATACGERFSEGAINILNSIPGVTHLVFGSESGNLEFMQKVAAIQTEESELFKRTLKEALDKGIPYAAAYGQATGTVSGSLAPKSPNDLLGIEYLKQLIKSGSAIRPVAIKRVGAGHHDTEQRDGFSSATAIRAFFESGDASAARNAMPEAAFELFLAELCQGQAATDCSKGMQAEALEQVLRQRRACFGVLTVLALRSREMSGCPDAGEGLEIKLKLNALEYIDLDKIIEKTKSKRYTEARVRRLCLQALLGITHYPTTPQIPAKLIGVRANLKAAILRCLPKSIIVKNKDFEKYAAALSPAESEAARYIWSVNKTAAFMFPLIKGREGDLYASQPILTV